MIKRYDIYLVSLEPVIGSEINKTRPCVIISDDMMNKFLNTVVVCPLTSKLHPSWRSRIQIICSTKEAEVAVDQIRTISTQRLIKKIDKLNSNKAKELRLLINEMYG